MFVQVDIQRRTLGHRRDTVDRKDAAPALSVARAAIGIALSVAGGVIAMQRVTDMMRQDPAMMCGSIMAIRQRRQNKMESESLEMR